MTATKRSHRLDYLALAAVCIFWGATYLGIRVGLETFSPAYLIAIRYVISGGILLLTMKATGVVMPRGRELWLTVLCGILGIGGGNGFLALSELYIPSGLAALFYTTAPFWMVGLDAVLPEGKKPLLRTLVGLFVGLGGVFVLVYPAAREGWGSRTITGFILIEVSAAVWVLASLLQKRVHSHAPAIVTGAIQQFAAGLFMFIPAVLFEKLPPDVGLRPILAIAYLVFFGSIIGYTSFVHSVKTLPVAIVSIYYFVNPVVAVTLGWIMFREPFSLRAAVAMVIVFIGIGIVRWSESQRAARATQPVAEESSVAPE